MSIQSLDSISNNLAPIMMSFHEKKDLDALYRVNKLFRKLVIQEYKLKCDKINFIPKSLPAGVNYKDFFLDLFPNKIDADFIRKNIGEVDSVPLVPVEFIERAQPGFNLAFIPEYITIETSTFELDESTAVDGRKARLIENPNSELAGIVREIKVPITLNNIILLFKKLIPAFKGIEFAWQNILDQHGDVGVGSSHWSYQKQGVFERGVNYPRQVLLATKAQLEIVSLTKRVFFDLVTCMKTKKFPQSDYFERTSTVTLSDHGSPWQSVIWWPASGASFRLCLARHIYDFCDSSSVCAVAGVPVGSS